MRTLAQPLKHQLQSELNLSISVWVCRTGDYTKVRIRYRVVGQPETRVVKDVEELSTEL